MRTRIEDALADLGHVLFRRAWWVIVGVLVVIGTGATQIPNIQVKASTDEFLRKGDPVKRAYDAFLQRFGRDDMIIIAIEPPV